ncbi:hypothetical protein JCM21531_2851 [Acetivibrio straminisolvens JCM 21531]|jgi:hypothetical protein|uniref:Uncharacterized protein n=1 Tax=Acetivibrio straminisolvens JCM 21531 TaxID=1294263 RepID=W4V944_9FIRM|nr:hypothetical protein JCM21531_2851 [Acetivibrio straminisolvens JCM 21531]
MIFFLRLILAIILLWIFVRTISYGKWTWDEKNRLGAIMIFVIALAAVALPILVFYIRY